MYKFQCKRAREPVYSQESESTEKDAEHRNGNDNRWLRERIEREREGEGGHGNHDAGDGQEGECETKIWDSEAG